MSNPVSEAPASTGQGFNRYVIRSAAFWVFGGYAFGQIFRLASNLIMTRLLAPEMFGIMALANVVIAGIQMVTDVGIQKSIIQSKAGTHRDFLDTAWILQIFRGISLAAIIFGIAIALWVGSSSLPAESVYADPDLPAVLAILAFSLVVSGFRSTKSATSNRELRLARVTSIELASQLLSIITMVTWATYSPTIWALVAGTIVANVAKVLAEYILLPGYNNRWKWQWDHAREIFHFGKWIFATSLLGYWVLNGDRIILAFDITAAEMGIYSIAIFIVGSVRGALNSIMQKVMYPALSRAVREGENCSNVYYRFRLPLDLIICGFCGFLFVSGSTLIEVLYDDRYSQAGPFLAVLAIGLFADRYRGLGLYYQATGKPKKMLPIALSRAMILSVGLPFFLYEYGFYAAVVFLGIYPLFVVPLQLYLKWQAGLMSITREIIYTAFLLPGVITGYLFVVFTKNYIG
ncbi:oligosaccharide flippase family protein [Microbulbifer agarilyticus]|uniref:oligosaccharide flippase family protein n=1 Tax=Microbulbifer agarilyticus TaxID=260552 RepID=UPI001CD4ED87|nr:oligosaccharide flippase family protein [Microbulbifer agarilyticus]MCA0900242.1 oligosaccharide flippase family protein [Microbulbifer agarilyticus]